MQNPFTYGNPISNPARFFNRKREIEQVFSRLQNAEFESSSLVGERRIGKTSLLNYLANPSVHHAHGFDLNHYLFVYVDLQMIDHNTTPVHFWQRLLRQVALSCQQNDVKNMLEKILAANSIETFILADFFDILANQELHIVLLLDEFDHVTENSNFGPGFFNGLRSLAIRRSHNLALVTSSFRELVELCHSEIIRSSPLFNIFANINLRLFTEIDAQHFISHSLSGTGVYFTDQELDFIFRIAGYHPYFLQVACFFLFESYRSKISQSERTQYLKKAFRDEVVPHFSHSWRRSNDQEKIVLTTLTLLERQQKIEGLAFQRKKLQDHYVHSTQVLLQLEKRGLVISKAGSYSLFNASFSEWIYQEITDTLHDQQTYNEWLQSNRDVMQRLSRRAKKDLGELLPKISSRYRELIINWACDPQNLITIAGLLKAVLGFHSV